MLNTFRPRQNGRHFLDDIFKCIFLNENIWISIKISLKFVPQGPTPALVKIMAWHRPGDKPLSDPLMVRLSTHICVTRPQWVKLYTRKIVLEKKNFIDWLTIFINSDLTMNSTMYDKIYIQYLSKSRMHSRILKRGCRHGNRPIDTGRTRGCQHGTHAIT